MIYTCQHCGAWFPADTLSKAVKNNETIITCVHCGMTNEFRSMKSSHIAKGFDYLSIGDFYRATYSFSMAIDDAKHHNHHASCDAYLGYALAQFRVQTIFSDDDSERESVPKLICHKCNEIYFADSEAYLNAENSVREEIGDYNMCQVELHKLNAYKDYIDAIKTHYDNIKNSKGDGFKYGAFIAYEDDPEAFNTAGFENAHKVRNNMPSVVKEAFLPDLDEYSSLVEYEAAILYALENSNCMVVITDNDIDSRLTNIFSRFYFNNRSKSRGGVNNLGFVRYCGHITITLPDKSIAEKNVFDIDNKADYVDFINKCNNVYGIDSSEAYDDGDDEDEDTKQKEVAEMQSIVGDPDAKPYKFRKGKQIVFGRYPQRRVQSKEIENYFAKFEKPTPSDSRGWKVLLVSKKGNPYTWYRDEEINGKMYRGVYFMKFRDVYSLQKSDIPAKEQRGHSYMPMRVYCFAFQPLIWNIEDMSSDMAVLIADQGLDSREYNNIALSNVWNDSTMHQWLNSDFLETAFTDEERNYLCMLAGSSEEDKVYLMDKKFDKSFYEHYRKAIHGSDYFQCVGGMGDRVVNCYWITGGDSCKESQASVIHPSSKNGIATQYVDCTTVAVLPKIILRLNM